MEEEEEKKCWKSSTGKFSCICYSMFPNLNGLTMLLKGFGISLSETMMFGLFQSKVRFSSADYFTVKSILEYQKKSVLMRFRCVQKLVHFSFEGLSLETLSAILS